MSDAAFAGVDWGTSSFRLSLMSADGKPLAERRSDEGMQHCAGGVGFRPVLDRHLAAVRAPADLPVVICGMAGARQGWMEAPYLHTPAELNALPAQAVSVPIDGRDIRILPGIAQVTAEAPSVMRGEETQLLGAVGAHLPADFTGLVCMPGTHCKWVRLQAGKVLDFATFLTGELFSLLTQHSILSHAMEPDSHFAATTPAYREAVATVQGDPGGGWSSLFALRAAQLLGFSESAEGAARLSGLLIGAEIAAAGRLYGREGEILLLHAGALGDLYAMALKDCGYSLRALDADAAARKGLAVAAARLWLKDDTHD